MIRFIRFATNLAAVAAILLPSGVAYAAGGLVKGTFVGLSLTVSNETAPPGGMAQMKVLLTEPQPIGTGKGSLSLSGFSTISGIAVMGPTPDVAGIAVVRGSSVDVSMISPSATYGLSLGYPILTVAGRVSTSTPLGSKFPVTFDGLQFLDASGAVYPTEFRAGQLLVAKTVAIGDVLPGSALVPAGGVVTITGSNFVSNTKIQINGGKIAQVRYISPTEIDVVLGAPLTMHGVMVKATNPDNTQSTYYSYQRTYRSSISSDPVMQFVMPLFSPVSVNTATVSLPAPAYATTYGVALQNVDTADAVSTVELLDAAGNPIAVSSLTVSPSTYVVRELTELFGFVPAGVSGVRVTSSSAPIEIMGVAADQVWGTATPILAH